MTANTDDAMMRVGGPAYEEMDEFDRRDEATSDLEPGEGTEEPTPAEAPPEDPNEKWGVKDFLHYRRVMAETAQAACDVGMAEITRSYDEGNNPHYTFGGAVALSAIQLTDMIRRAAKLSSAFVPPASKKEIEEFAELANNALIEIIKAVAGEERANEIAQAVAEAEEENIRLLEQAQEKWNIMQAKQAMVERLKASQAQEGIPTYHPDDETKGVN